MRQDNGQEPREHIEVVVINVGDVVPTSYDRWEFAHYRVAANPEDYRDGSIEFTDNRTRVAAAAKLIFDIGEQLSRRRRGETRAELVERQRQAEAEFREAVNDVGLLTIDNHVTRGGGKYQTIIVNNAPRGKKPTAALALVRTRGGFVRDPSFSPIRWVESKSRTWILHPLLVRNIARVANFTEEGVILYTFDFNSSTFCSVRRWPAEEKGAAPRDGAAQRTRTDEKAAARAKPDPRLKEPITILGVALLKTTKSVKVQTLAEVGITTVGDVLAEGAEAKVQPVIGTVGKTTWKNLLAAAKEYVASK